MTTEKTEFPKMKDLVFELKNFNPNKVNLNNGQIEGVPRNPRFIRDERYEDLKHSILTKSPMLKLREIIAYKKPDGEIVVICGNMRIRASRELKMDKVPIKVLDPATEAFDLRAIAVIDKVPFGEDDVDIFANEWDQEELIDFGMQIDFGFYENDDPEDDGFEMPDEIETDLVLGDFIEIGNHKLLCGDSTISTDVEKLLKAKEPYLMVTDPPYGVEYDPKWRAKAGVSKNKKKMGEVKNDDNADWTDAWALSPCKVAYVWHASKYTSIVQESLERCDFEIRSQIIWVKDKFALSRGNYHWQHEPCWYAVKKGNKGNWAGDRSQSTTWQSREDGGYGHGTQKPVNCMYRPLQNHDGDVYDPFLGSGTTMVAAQLLGRICYGMELNPKYCQVIIDRMLNLDPDLEVKINNKKYKK